MGVMLAMRAWLLLLLLLWGVGRSSGIGRVRASPATTDCADALTDAQRDWLRSTAAKEAPDGADWPPLGTEALDCLATLALAAYDSHMEFNTYMGQAVDLKCADADCAEPSSYSTLGDATHWSGSALAGLVHKYVAERDNGFADDAAATMDAIAEAVDTLESMIHCTGKKGYVPRAIGYADDDEFMAYAAGYGGGNFSCVDTDLVWLGDSSRDTYLGFALGLSTVMHSVEGDVDGSDVAAHVASSCNAMAQHVLDDLLASNWVIESPEKQFTRTTPLVRSVFCRMGLTANASRYAGTTCDGYTAMVAAGMLETRPHSEYNTGYYPNYLSLIGMYSLRILESDADIQATIDDEFARFVTQTQHHLQASGAALYLHATGATDAVQSAILQGTAVDFPVVPKTEQHVDQSANPDYADTVDVQGETMSKTALLVRDRPFSYTFLWNQYPTRLSGGSDSGSYEFYQTVDAFLPYFVGVNAHVFPFWGQ